MKLKLNNYHHTKYITISVKFSYKCNEEYFFESKFHIGILLSNGQNQ